MYTTASVSLGDSLIPFPASEVSLDNASTSDRILIASLIWRFLLLRWWPPQTAAWWCSAAGPSSTPRPLCAPTPAGNKLCYSLLVTPYFEKPDFRQGPAEGRGHHAAEQPSRVTQRVLPYAALTWRYPASFSPVAEPAADLNFGCCCRSQRQVLRTGGERACA